MSSPPRPTVTADDLDAQRPVRRSQPKGAAWSSGPPPARPPTPEDWNKAPRLSSFGWIAWLVGMSSSTLRQMMDRDIQLRDRLRYAAPGRGHRWWFTARVRDWVEGRQWRGQRVVPGPAD